MTNPPGANPPPLPVTVVSGYLGAGKTTLVNAILTGEHGLRIAVLVNDFGSISIDETLIAGRGVDVVALANGCMCCQVGGALYDAIDRILKMRDRFDHLLIETSGVADPAKVAQIAVAEPDLELARTIVLVDTVNFAACLGDPRLADTLLRQLRAADVIFLTKGKDASLESLVVLHAALRDCASGIETLPLEKGSEDAWTLVALERQQMRDLVATPLRPHRLPFESWSWEGEAAVDRDALVDFVGDPALGAYRLKGRLRLSDGKAVVVQKVGAKIAIEEARGPVPVSELVAVGPRPKFDRSLLERAWAQRVANTPRNDKTEQPEALPDIHDITIAVPDL